MVGEALANGAGDHLVGHYVGVGDQLRLLFVIGTKGVLFSFVLDQLTGLQGQLFGEFRNGGNGFRVRHDGALRSEMRAPVYHDPVTGR